MSNDSFIKLFRRTTEWEWYTDHSCFRLFMHLLLTANYKPSRFRGKDIPAGAKVAGIQALAEQTGLTVQQVRTAVNKLKSTNEITIESTTQFSVITITKWNDYQDDNRQNNKPVTNEQQTNNKPTTTSKEGKKERKDIITPTPLADENSESEKPKKANPVPPNPQYGSPDFQSWEECYQDFVDVWNERAERVGLPTCQALNDVRRKAIRTLFANECGGDAQNFRKAVDNLTRDQFCLGFNDRKWQANFDYILRKDKFLSFFEKG